MTTDHAWAGQCRPSVVFTLDVAAKPVLTFEAANLREAAQLCYEEWLREDLMSLRSNDVPLWDVKALIRARYATPDETEHFATPVATLRRPLVTCCWRISSTFHIANATTIMRLITTIAITFPSSPSIHFLSR